MDHTATMRRIYVLINAGDVDGFSDVLADDFVDHEELPGLEPTKEGVKAFFRMYIAAFPDLRMDAEDVLPSGDKVVARISRVPDPAIIRIVDGWPRNFDTSRAESLGFKAEKTFEEIIKVHLDDELGGKLV